MRRRQEQGDYVNAYKAALRRASDFKRPEDLNADDEEKAFLLNRETKPVPAIPVNINEARDGALVSVTLKEVIEGNRIRAKELQEEYRPEAEDSDYDFVTDTDQTPEYKKKAIELSEAMYEDANAAADHIWQQAVYEGSRLVVEKDGLGIYRTV